MEWLSYQNQGAVRNQPLSPALIEALSFLPEMGVSMEVFSGGQPKKGTSTRRVGSTRHDGGNAADVFFNKGGKRLDWSNPDDLPVFQEIVRKAKGRGVTGIGAGPGYMRLGSMHIGFGEPAVWGAEGKGVNAPEWLRAAYNGTPARVQSSGGNDTLLGGPDTSPTQSDTLEAPMQGQGQEMATGLLGLIFPEMTEERADRFRLGLNGMLHNPNQALQASVLSRVADRQEQRKEARADQRLQKQANKTAEVLRQQGAPEYLVAAAEQGQGAAALKEFLRLRAEANEPFKPVKGVEINGQLINPVTGAQMGDYRDKGEDLSAQEQKIERIVQSFGVDRQTAIGIVDGVLRVSRDPYDQSVIVTNLATQESYQPTITGQSEQPEPSPQPSSPTEPQVGNISEAMGLEGAVKSGINRASDYLGLGTPFENVRDARSDMAHMKESLTSLIARGYDRQPPSWLLKNIQDLIPDGGGGADGALSQLETLQRGFKGELDAVSNPPASLSPQERRVLSERKAALEEAMRLTSGMISRFQPSGGPQRTSSGVQWQIER